MSDPRTDAAWILGMVKLEEELGEIVPGGAQGRVRAPSVTPSQGESKTHAPAVARARRRVRFTFQAIERPARLA